MGGVITVRPTGTIAGNTAGWSPSTGTLAGVAGDNSDTTYMADSVTGSSSFGHQAWFTLASGAGSLPAGAAITRITAKARASQATGAQHLYFDLRCYSSNRTKMYYYAGAQSILPASAIKTFVQPAGRPLIAAPADLPEFTPAYLAGHLELVVRTSNSEMPYTATGDDRVYDVWAEIEYDEQPVANDITLIPSDANTRTTRPAVGWTYSDPESTPQQAWRVVVWSATDAADANCPKAAATSFTAAGGGTRTAVAYSGTAADPSVPGTDQQWQLTADLTASGSYKVFVQTADQVAGVTRWSTQVGELAWTQAVTVPGAPTSVTPTWVGSPTWATQVSVVVPSWAHTPATARTVLVQRSTDGGATWQDIPTSPSAAGDGQTGATVVRYDTGLRHGQTASYRAQAYHDDGLYQYASPWTTSGGTAAGSIDRWLLRDAADGALPPAQLAIAGDLDSVAEEEVTFWRPAGSRTEVSVAEAGAVGGETWQASVAVAGETAWQALLALRARQKTLLLVNDMGTASRWVRFGRTWRIRLARSTARVSSTTRPRFVDVELHEVRPPSGQPASL